MELALADLVHNGTMSTEVAATLGAAGAERRSFLVVALPRFAGKSTVMRAILAHAPRGTPLRVLGEDGDDVAALAGAARGGYLVVPEVSRFPVAPGYVWGAPVREAFHAIADGTSLATALHAASAEQSLEVLLRLNRVPAADVARLHLVVYIRSLGPDMREPLRRVIATVHAVDGASGGRVALRLLHRWDEANDRFETVDALI
jgi:hypothetical protein